MKRSRTTRRERSDAVRRSRSRRAKDRPPKTAKRAPSQAADHVVDADPDDPVSFTVVCAPANGATLGEMRRRLSVRTVREFKPDEATRLRIVIELKQFGFEVFAGHGPVITARGTVKRFTEAFGGTFEKVIHERRIPGTPRVQTETSIRLRRGSEPPSPKALTGALLITVSVKPTLATPLIPPTVAGFNLRVPGDIALLTRASATHRRSTPSGDRATGGGITVAVIDTGFAEHPYYSGHDYRITRLSAADVTAPPTDDPVQHGTCMLAGLFACAPDVHALAIKFGEDPVVALHDAMNYGGVNVISLSWGYDLYGETKLESGDLDLFPMQLVLVEAIASGITVVAAAGNGAFNFPAMMPEVIAVGGVAANTDDSLVVWAGASSFRSAIFKGRDVPDLCGLAPDTLVPFESPAAGPDWQTMLGGTSLATCQVAGVAALLLQKVPGLTPLDVRIRLMGTAVDITSGTSATGDKATTGPDLASGAGMVDALAAWNSLS